jgi:hypothetical protein
LLLAAAAGSLAALLALRLYAALFAVPVQTPWDDGALRHEARLAAQKEAGAQLLVTAVTPHAPPVLGGRINAYGEWLALGAKIGARAGSPSALRSFQLVNFALLLVLVGAVTAFGRWASRDAATGVSLAFLFASSPVVFGLNRWVLTENLVLAAGPLLSFLTAWLGTPRAPSSRGRASTLAVAGAAAYVMGLLAYAREYVFPTYAVLVVLMVAALFAQRRLAEAAVVSAVTAAFVIPLAGPLAQAIRITVAKSEVALYFHPLSRFLPHVALYVLGPSLALLFLAFFAAAAWLFLRRLAGGRPSPALARVLVSRAARALRSGTGALSFGHWVLLGLYAAAIVASRNRSVRTAVPPLLAALGALLLFLRRHPGVRRGLLTTRARLVTLALLGSAWGLLGYQLFFAFDGGRTWAHAAYRLEYFNYPLGIRVPERPGDHVCYRDCPYDSP